MEAIQESKVTPLRSNRRILIIAGPKGAVDASLAPHEVLFAKNLDTSLELISSQRPDLVIYFAKGHHEDLEEHVMTWLIQGFRGKFILFDPMNRVKEFQTLLESQVVDEYLSGPVSPGRFVSIVKSQLSQDIRFASPRAMTTFDLFRNLFDRGLNAIFFLSEDLNRCVAANIRAEQLTGKSLYDLRRIGLKELCSPEELDNTMRIIRRAGRQYYDSRGMTELLDRFKRAHKMAFSCGVFNFGRQAFVKLEVQESLENTTSIPLVTPARMGTRAWNSTMASRDTFLQALDQNLYMTQKNKAAFSLILCKIRPNPEKPSSDHDSEAFMEKVFRALEESCRQSDTVARLGPQQFAVFLPKSATEKSQGLVDRLRHRLESIPEINHGNYLLEVGVAQFPPEAYPFMHLLRSAENPNAVIMPHN